ncbi:MAG: fructose-1,6-bisphosphatase [Actinobacteria bacterium]|nr:fructose-1,6-bisphosphatase [Actinomycetota bacterium]MBU1944763.1 fructose-1,6-bisphosphatase [Actinomycetota bacterium]MBU2688854.1 fructose-1,6-bisphosphatase [Actinomycetota bacterium]
MEVTLSIIKADVGGFVGHSDVHPELRKCCVTHLDQAKKEGLIIDYAQGEVGDDIALIMTHTKGIENEEIHKFAWNTFTAMTEVARQYGQYGAGQDLLVDAFSGNLKGMGPGFAEMTIVERPSEPIIIFLADKTEPGAWNMPLYKMFADPFNTIGLVIDPSMHEGFRYEVLDLIGERQVIFETPEEIYDMLVLIGSPSRYVIKHIFRKGDNDEPVAVTSTQRLFLMAGRYVGKDDPVMAVRCQSGLPAVGEVLEPFAFPHAVAGWMRGSHHGPLMPVGIEDDTPTRFDGPPRVVALGFQLKDGMLIGPRDMFSDKSYDNARQQALDAADYLRRHGPFEPHRLPLEEMEYTTMPAVMKKLKDRFKAAD